MVPSFMMNSLSLLKTSRNIGVFSLDPIKHFLPPINVNYVYRVFVFIVFGGPIIKVSRKTVFAPFY